MGRNIFLVGKTPELALLELQTVLKRFGFSDKLKPAGEFLYLPEAELPEDEIEKLQAVLGGTVKIFKDLDQIGSQDRAVDIARILDRNTEGKVSFTLLSFEAGMRSLEDLSVEIKKELVKRGRLARYTKIRPPHSFAGTKTTEVLIYSLDGIARAAVRLAGQDLNRWNALDYDRPASDPAAGMLPPKVARMMVNIGIGTNSDSQASVYDPFCGTGTILLQAMELGFAAAGSDIRKEAVEMSRQNGEWYMNRFNNPQSFQVFKADATGVTGGHLDNLPETIVFEGYLGPAKIRPQKLENLYKGLTKLYQGTFKNLAQILPKGKLMVAALPEFVTEKGVKTMDSLVDSCEKYGYTQFVKPITYGRDQAIVKRRIYFLEKL